jgi:hypothetical protein
MENPNAFEPGRLMNCTFRSMREFFGLDLIFLLLLLVIVAVVVVTSLSESLPFTAKLLLLLLPFSPSFTLVLIVSTTAFCEN